MIPTDEIVEKAARAIFEEKQGLRTWDACISKDNFRRYARACISAILPDIVEECAKVADRADHGWLRAVGADWGPSEIAASIRQLSTNTKG